MENKITISQSEIATWSRCPRQWYLKYYRGIVPAEEAPTGNMQLGGRVHTALEGWYGYGLDPLAVLEVLYKIEMEARPDDAAELRKERDLADAMVGGYVEWAAAEGIDADSKVIATETDLQIPFPADDRVILRARLDAVRQMADGAWLWDDYKTSDTFETAETSELNPQMRFYSMMARLASQDQPDTPPVLGGRIVTLRRVKRTSKAKPPFYGRHEFRFPPEVVTAEYLRVAKVVREIMDARQSFDWAAAQGGAPEEAAALLDITHGSMARPNLMPHDCAWRCPFSKGLCYMMDDGSDWQGALERSGRWRTDDPYAYYRRDALQTVRKALAELT